MIPTIQSENGHQLYPIKTPTISTPVDFFQITFFANNEHNKADEYVQKEVFKRGIHLEVEKLKNLLAADNIKVIRETSSKNFFWIEHVYKFPHLYKLALILANINSLSAIFERYYIICGFTQDKRKQNISEQLFIAKCLIQ